MALRVIFELVVGNVGWEGGGDGAKVIVDLVDVTGVVELRLEALPQCIDLPALEHAGLAQHPTDFASSLG